MAKRDPREVALLSARLRRLLDTWGCRIPDASKRLGMANSSFCNALYGLNAPRGFAYKAICKKLKSEERKAGLTPWRVDPNKPTQTT